jgi:hypothetical protein
MDAALIVLDTDLLHHIVVVELAGLDEVLTREVLALRGYVRVTGQCRSVPARSRPRIPPPP